MASRSRWLPRGSRIRAPCDSRRTATCSSPTPRPAQVRVYRFAEGSGDADRRGRLRRRAQPALWHRLLSAGDNPEWIYIAESDGLKRFPYKERRPEGARGEPETLVQASRPSITGRATSRSRPMAGRCIYSVGSGSNVGPTDDGRRSRTADARRSGSQRHPLGVAWGARSGAPTCWPSIPTARTSAISRPGCATAPA